MPLAPGARLGHYEIVAPIGAGGMGEVYKARDARLDRDVALKVLPSHLAADPEALARFEREAKAADERSDIFSFGCVLFELATGKRPFQRDTTAETMTAILREDAPEVGRPDGLVPAPIEQLVRHCLEKRPDERFQSARDLAFALSVITI